MSDNFGSLRRMFAQLPKFAFRQPARHSAHIDKLLSWEWIKGLLLSGPRFSRTTQPNRLCLRLPFKHSPQGSQLLAGVLGAMGSISALKRCGQIEPGLRVELPLEVEIVFQVQGAGASPSGAGGEGAASWRSGRCRPGGQPSPAARRCAGSTATSAMWRSAARHNRSMGISSSMRT